MNVVLSLPCYLIDDVMFAAIDMTAEIVHIRIASELMSTMLWHTLPCLLDTPA